MPKRATQKSGKKSSVGSVTYDGLLITQRPKPAPQLILFTAPVAEILSWAVVEELGPRRRGSQRQRREAKMDAIRKFLQADPRNTIPTAVIVAFPPSAATVTANGAGSDVRRLRVGGAGTKKGTIVDGQHRLYGATRFDSGMRIPVIGILDADDVEKAFQFLIINNKATRVPVVHTKALLAKMAKTGLGPRLQTAKIAFDAEGIKDVDIVNTDPDSPFFKSVDWPTTPAANRIVPATAIEASLDYLEGLSVPEFEDRDVRRSVFLTIWKVVRSTWSKLWVADSRLVSKVGIICLTRFVADLVVSWSDNEDLAIELSDLDDIETETKKILTHMDRRFWTVPWSERAQGGFDTNQGRDRVSAALKQLYRNGRGGLPWHTDIDILDATAASESASGGTKKTTKKKSA